MYYYHDYNFANCITHKNYFQNFFNNYFYCLLDLKNYYNFTHFKGLFHKKDFLIESFTKFIKIMMKGYYLVNTTTINIMKVNYFFLFK